MHLVKFLGLGSVVLSGVLFAQEPTNPNPDGIESARKLCEFSLGSETKMQCLETLKAAKYIEPQAVRICDTHSEPSRVHICVKAILNKKYSAQELETCKGLMLAPKILECLSRIGRIHTPIPEPKKEAKKTIPADKINQWKLIVDQALRALDKNESSKAKSLLEELYLRMDPDSSTADAKPKTKESESANPDAVGR